MKLEKIGQLAGWCSIEHGGEKESLTLCWKTRSGFRVDCRLVRAINDDKNEDTCASE